MDKRRLQQLAGIITEAVKKCSCGCDVDKCKCKSDCKCGCNKDDKKDKKVVEYANAFGQDGNDGSGGGGVEGEEMEMTYDEENEEGQGFKQALQVIAKEIVKGAPQAPEGQSINSAELAEELMQGRWREMLKDEIMDILEPGPSSNPDGMSRTEPHITF